MDSRRCGAACKRSWSSLRPQAQAPPGSRASVVFLSILLCRTMRKRSLRTFKIRIPLTLDVYLGEDKHLLDLLLQPALAKLKNPSHLVLCQEAHLRNVQALCSPKISAPPARALLRSMQPNFRSLPRLLCHTLMRSSSLQTSLHRRMMHQRRPVRPADCASIPATSPAVPGTPDPVQHQVQARLLYAASSALPKTVNASGAGHTPATIATGTLIFYNSSPSPVTIPAGTVFTDASGIEIVTARAASLPAGNPPTVAQSTVPAHAVYAGASGNIPAFAFNNVPCCANGVFVQNGGAFSGGRAQQNLPHF